MGVGSATVSVAVAVVILRNRLYDIDLINGTLIYGALTGGLAPLYWGGAALLQGIPQPLTGGSELAIVGSTLVVAAAFQPVRRWIQRNVDRRFYRNRYDAHVTLAQFTSRLKREVGAERTHGRFSRRRAPHDGPDPRVVVAAP